MTTIRTQHTGASNHGSNAIAQFKLSTEDITYMGFALQFMKGDTPATLAQIKQGVESIKLKLDGETKCEISAKDLVVANNYQYEAEEDGFLNFHLRKMYKNGWDSQDFYGIGCHDVRNAVLEVKYANHTIASDMKSELWMEHTTNSPLLRFERIIPLQGYQAGAAGKKTIRDLFSGSKNASASVISKLIINNENVDKVTVKRGTTVLHESTKATRNALARQYKRKPQAGYTIIDFDLEGRLSNGILASSGLIMEVETTQSIDSFDILQFVEVGAKDELPN